MLKINLTQWELDHNLPNWLSPEMKAHRFTYLPRREVDAVKMRSYT
jgi:hypothetical protein